MEKTLNHYVVNKNTLAICSIASCEFSSIVYEIDQILYVRQTPLKIIQVSCLANGSTHKGRCMAVSYHTNNRHKLPVPISEKDSIYFFPTSAPNNFHCHWISYHHVLHLQLAKNQETIITFRNGLQLTISVSFYTIEKQLHRTAHLRHLFSGL
ncbi:competence protein ComK [Anaerobacillus alkaliphilus]|uniref:competence protein ComK n=1 Tax=Anaerobacillus alkaliphilus TaxID=1548597 RepID=UPI00137645A5|nr:competence protein ComK [Anaerobacillus alkaliphilus]